MKSLCCIFAFFCFAAFNSQAQTPGTRLAPHPSAAGYVARQQFSAALAEFRKDPANSELRAKVIDLANALKPAPLVPQAARAGYAKAMAQLAHGSAPEDFEAAARSFEQVTAQAPWYADAYLNAATADVKAGDLEGAERNLATYMTAVRPGVSTAVAESLQHQIDAQQTRRQFDQDVASYRNNLREDLREQIVKLAAQLEPRPAIPDEAQQHYAKGKALAAAAMETQNFDAAIAEFKDAIQAAPWWPDPARDLEQTQAAARQATFESLLQQLRQTTRYTPEDQELRKKIIGAVREMPAPPPISDDAVRFMARGEAFVKMGGAGSYTSAATEIEQAVMVAPWSADAYFNLGIVQDSAGMYKEAIENLQLYLLAAPQAANARAVQTKIYELEVMNEDQQKTQTLAGTWKSEGGAEYKVVVNGQKLKIEAEIDDLSDENSPRKMWRSFDLEKKGATLEGTVAITLGDVNGCAFPSETIPVTGEVSEDFSILKLDFQQTNYRWGFYPGTDHCIGVSSLGSMDISLKLTREPN